MPYADLGEFRMFYGEDGEGEALIFLHGFTLDRRMWQKQAEFFAPHYHVIVPDSRGHGLSEVPQSGYSRADRVEDLKAFADTLEIEQFHLVGLSMGGSTAIGMALSHPERLKSLTLVSTGAAGYSAGKRFSKLDQIAREQGYEPVRERWMKMALLWYRDRREDLRPLMETMILEHSGAVWMDPQRGQYPREYDLERVDQIRTPTMIIAGELDKVFVELSRTLHEKIDGSQMHVYDGVGHMVNMEVSGRFNSDLKVFLEGVSGR